MTDLAVKPYWAFFSIYLKDLVSQRLELLSSLVSIPFSIIAISAIWIALNQAGYAGFGGFTTTELISYAIFGAIIRKIVNNAAVGTFVESDITNGDFIVNLCRPIEHWKYQLTLRFSQLMINIPIGLVLIIATIFVFNQPIHSLFAILLVIILLLEGFLFSFFEYYAIGVLSFWLERIWGVRYGLELFERYITGSLFPLTILPLVIQNFLHYLPFGHTIFTPVALLMGKITESQAIEGIVILGIWVIVGFIITKKIWKLGLSKYDGKM